MKVLIDFIAVMGTLIIPIWFAAKHGLVEGIIAFGLIMCYAIHGVLSEKDDKED